MAKFKILKNIFIAALALLVWLVPLEFGLRWYFSQHGNPVDKVIRILRPDMDMLWRQRANARASLWGQKIELNQFGFRDQAKQENPFAILLGPSSGFGWGLASTESYAEQLEKKIQNHSGDISDTVLNASQIGFSTAQGIRLAQAPELTKWKPKIVLLAYGINDLDRFRFFGQEGLPDEEYLQKNKNIEPAWLYQFSLYYALQKIIRGLKIQNDCRSLGYPEIRVSQKELENNFSALAKWAKDRGAKPVVLTTPLWLKGKKISDNAIAINEQLYRESLAAAKAGNCRDAWQKFQQARLGETERIAASVRRQNQSLKQWAMKSGVEIIDVAPLLHAEEHFVDPVHPSAEGHRLIAEKIFLHLSALGIFKK